MRILILANSLGGLFSFRIELLDALLEQGNDVIVCAPDDKLYSDKLIEKGIKFISTEVDRRGTNPLADARLLKRYVALLKEVRPDVVLTYTIKPNIYGGMACRLCGVPQIVNITGLGTAVENPGWLQQITLALYRVALKRAKCIFFQNEFNKRFFAKHKINNKAHRLIPGSGVNLNRFDYSQYPSDSEPIRFLFMGRLMKEKGIEEYFAVAKHFKAKDISTEFHIVGDCEDDYLDELGKLQELGVVVWHGRQANVKPFIEAAHCLIHPSYYPEGMSNVILESAATGRPVITTRRPGCGETVDDGLTGYLIDEKDTKGLISKVQQFINLPYLDKVSMGRKANEKMRNQFDRRIVVKAYLDEIKSI